MPLWEPQLIGDVKLTTKENSERLVTKIFQEMTEHGLLEPFANGKPRAAGAIGLLKLHYTDSNATTSSRE